MSLFSTIRHLSLSPSMAPSALAPKPKPKPLFSSWLARSLPPSSPHRFPPPAPPATHPLALCQHYRYQYHRYQHHRDRQPHTTDSNRSFWTSLPRHSDKTELCGNTDKSFSSSSSSTSTSTSTSAPTPTSTSVPTPTRPRTPQTRSASKLLADRLGRIQPLPNALAAVCLRVHDDYIYLPLRNRLVAREERAVARRVHAGLPAFPTPPNAITLFSLSLSPCVLGGVMTGHPVFAVLAGLLHDAGDRLDGAVAAVIGKSKNEGERREMQERLGVIDPNNPINPTNNSTNNPTNDPTDKRVLCDHDPEFGAFFDAMCDKAYTISVLAGIMALCPGAGLVWKALACSNMGIQVWLGKVRVEDYSSVKPLSTVKDTLFASLVGPVSSPYDGKLGVPFPPSSPSSSSSSPSPFPPSSPSSFPSSPSPSPASPFPASPSVALRASSVGKLATFSSNMAIAVYPLTMVPVLSGLPVEAVSGGFLLLSLDMAIRSIRSKLEARR